ncbi:hypothetical protein [Pseudomonas sp. FFUP_PS_473]|uniref:hypothetical protein n=1 Tax=Pseudomonas sp. FFUP_PS_473 TaxID=2060418 RepID=UPI002113C01F|nr:hypothetical protein [Pseudomonas sp. FFUP_PS_473]
MPARELLQIGTEGYLKGPLFRTIGRGTGLLSSAVLPEANADAMVRRRALAVGIQTLIGNHIFKATGITADLKNGDTLVNAAAMPPPTFNVLPLGGDGRCDDRSEVSLFSISDAKNINRRLIFRRVQRHPLLTTVTRDVGLCLAS